MSAISPLLSKLIKQLSILPGVGPKSAQRMALHLLQHKTTQTRALAHCIIETLDNLTPCVQCRNFCEGSLCSICLHPEREQNILCIVETIADLVTIEHTGIYRGLYFVLMGHLSPIDRVGPEELGIPQLLERCNNQSIEEIIIATNPTIEGEVTANYLAEHMPPRIKISRLASGVPMGSELEYLNENTLYQALTQRKTISDNT